jgi:ssDNA-specific exonuclease RecJ
MQIFRPSLQGIRDFSQEMMYVFLKSTESVPCHIMIFIIYTGSKLVFKNIYCQMQSQNFYVLTYPPKASFANGYTTLHKPDSFKQDHH